VAALPDTPEEMEGGQMGPPEPGLMDGGQMGPLDPGLPQEADNLRLGAEGEKNMSGFGNQLKYEKGRCHEMFDIFFRVSFVPNS